MNSLLILLNNSIESGDPDIVEEAVAAAFSVGLQEEHIPALIHLLELDWHTRHEDIVRALQSLKSPKAVDILYSTAMRNFDYLDYDEDFGLARKCTWALADIGTPDAWQKLQNLARSQNEIIAGYAQKRLDVANSE